MSVLKPFKKAWYAVVDKVLPGKRASLAKTAKNILGAASEAAYAQYIDTPSAEAMSSIASAASDLAKSFEQVDNVAARLGPLLFVKYTIDGTTYVRTETITPLLARTLDRNPRLMSSPQRLIEYFDDHSRIIDHGEQDDVS